MAKNSRPVALFRARDDAALTAEKLAARGVSSILAPVIEVDATGAAAPPVAFDFVVASSAKAFALASADAVRAASGLPLYVVGAKTAAAAGARGLSPMEYAADATELAARLGSVAGRALYLAGRDRRPDLEAVLGERATIFVVYGASAREGWSESEAREVAGAAAALHYSERSAALAVRFAQNAGIAAAFRGTPHVCLSRQVAGPLAAFGVTRALWPRAPEEEALFDTLETTLADFGFE